MWLLKVKLIKIKQNKMFNSLVARATLPVLKRQVWLVTLMSDTSDYRQFPPSRTLGLDCVLYRNEDTNLALHRVMAGVHNSEPESQEKEFRGMYFRNFPRKKPLMLIPSV